jgi:hypothetical protein
VKVVQRRETVLRARVMASRVDIEEPASAMTLFRACRES